MKLDGLKEISDLVHSTTINGVPVLWASGHGPMAAGLIFRVGRADETLATSGVTHLVEHLALHGQAGQSLHNGQTGDRTTHFLVTGDEDEVVSYLNGVCVALRNLPVDRLDTEKSILKTEAQGRGQGNDALQRRVRFGATGSGISGFAEFGLDDLDAGAVRAWSAEWFTRDNAVLWILSDHLPPGLELALPEGSYHPIPDEPSRLSSAAYVNGAPGALMIDAILPRSTEAWLFAAVAVKALFRTLRTEDGLSYTVDGQYEPIDADTARVLIWADALPEQQAAVVGGAIDALAALKAGRFDPRDLKAARALVLGGYGDADHRGAAVLVPSAMNLLVGADLKNPDELLARLKAVTNDELREVAERVWAGALWQVPEGGLEWAGVEPLPPRSAQAVEGVAYDQWDKQGRVILGESGVSQVSDNDVSTVLFSDCAANLAWPDGGRTLIGADGIGVSLEPTVLRGYGTEQISALDAAVATVTIDMPTRPPEQIPGPGPVPTGKARGFGPWAFAAMLAVVGLALYWSHLALENEPHIGEVGSNGAVVRLEGVLFTWGLVVVAVGAAIFLFAGVIRRMRWLRRQEIDGPPRRDS